MTQLLTCSACGGFVRPDASGCPHCGAGDGPQQAASGWLKLGTGLIACLGGGAFAVTLMACYGACPPGGCGGQDQGPPADLGESCAAIGGTCSPGGRCPAADGGAAQTYLDSVAACPGAGSTGAVCCIPCTVTASSPGICCSATASFNPVCVNGTLGCLPGTTGKPAGSTCP